MERTIPVTLPVTVCTASMPTRTEWLMRAMASVNAQSVAAAAHLIRIATPARGPNPGDLAIQRNRLLASVNTEWTAVLDDDDEYLQGHFQTISDALSGDADVVYTFANHGCVAREDVTGWSGAQLYDRLMIGNCISSNACIRTATLRAVNGWDEDFNYTTRRFASSATWEDWDLWLRLAQANAKFVCVPVATWDYNGGAPDRSTDVWDFTKAAP